MQQKQPKMGRMDAPLKMYGMVSASYKAANIWDGKCPILCENWDGKMPHRCRILKNEKERILLIHEKSERYKVMGYTTALSKYPLVHL